MTDFDCINETCATPTDCLQREACAGRPDRTVIQQIIDDTRERLRREK